MKNGKWLILWASFAISTYASSDPDVFFIGRVAEALHRRANHLLSDAIDGDETSKSMAAFYADHSACLISDGSSDSCRQLIHEANDSLDQSESLLSQAVETLKSLCKAGRGGGEICDSYANALEDIGEVGPAMDVHLQNCKGGYERGCTIGALFLQKENRQAEAWPLAKRGCELSTDGCAFHLRYFASGPDVEYFHQRVIKSCLSKRDSEGATHCAILGAFEYAHGRKLAALEYLNLECGPAKANPPSCFMSAAVAARLGDQHAALRSIETLCESRVRSIFAEVRSLLKEVCPRLVGRSRLPASTLEAASRTLSAFLGEQRL